VDSALYKLCNLQRLLVAKLQLLGEAGKFRDLLEDLVILQRSGNSLVREWEQ